MMEQLDVRVGDDRTVRAYDTGAASGDRVLMWHHGSPQTGEPLEPVVRAAAERGIRVLSYARPSYGGSTALAGRTVASAASDDEFDPESFVDADYAALEGEWAALGEDVGRSEQYGPDGLIDDDVAFAAPWGFGLGQVTAPVLLVQGGLDRMIPQQHAERLRRGIPHAVLWLRPQDGHVSVLGAVPEALDWVRTL